MKKAYSFRLSEQAILAIRVKAAERQCSEAAVIEAVFAGSSNGRTEGFGPSDVGSIPTPAAILKDELVIAKDEKRAMFEALKAKLAGGGKLSDLTEPVRLLDDQGAPNMPRAPFDFNEATSGEPHRVTQMGKKLGLFYMGGGEPAFNRFLAEGELEKFWEARIK